MYTHGEWRSLGANITDFRMYEQEGRIVLAGIVSRFGEVHAQEVPMPKIGEYDALVKIAACAFCNGTDSHIIEGTFPFISPLPVILGHESVGQVVEVGSKVRNYKAGD